MSELTVGHAASYPFDSSKYIQMTTTAGVWITKCDVLTKALKFYADKENWNGYWHFDEKTEPAVVKDSGKTARLALGIEHDNT